MPSLHDTPEKSTNLPFELLEQFIEGKVTVFVGAGLSADALPTWNNLMDSFGRSLGKVPEGSSHTDIAQFYEDKHGRAALIRRLRNQLELPVRRVLNIHRVLLTLPLRHIFTTNFDVLLETAIEDQGKQVTRIFLEEQVPDFRFDDSRSIHLVKIHGDISNAPTIVFTARDYESYFRAHPAMRRLTEFVLQTRIVLFLGYSFNDPDLRTMLGQVFAETGQFSLPAYIILFDAPDSVTDSFRKRNLHIINLATGGRTRTAVISMWLEELSRQIRVIQASQLAKTSPCDTPVFLPAPTYIRFVSRETDRAKVITHLHNYAVTLIQGLPGTGKTSIIHNIAHEYTPGKPPFFFQHVVWISVIQGRDSRTSLARVLDTVAKGTGYPLVAQLPSSDLKAKTEQVNKILAEHKCLIIIDDYERAEGDALEEWIQEIGDPAANQGNSKLIVISRHYPTRLSRVEWVVEILGLTEGEAVDFLYQQAEALKVETYVTRETRNTLLHLVHLVQGNPQALEQAIGLVAGAKRNFAQVIKQLESGIGTDIGDLLDLLCANSWKSLPTQARNILQVTPVFADPTRIAYDALQQVANIQEESQYHSAMNELKRLRLVEDDEIHRTYRIHSTIRMFAETQLNNAPSERRLAEKRLCNYNLQFIRQKIIREKPTVEYWNALVSSGMSEVDPEWPGIKQSVEWAHNNEPLQFVELVMILVHYLDSRFLNTERLTYVQQAIRILEQRKGHEGRLALLHLDALGWTYIEEGNWDSAEKEVATGLELAKQLPTENKRNLLALGFAWMGRIRNEQRGLDGEFDPDGTRLREAEAFINQAFAEDVIDPWILSRIYMSAGDMDLRTSAFKSALDRYEHAVATEKEYDGEGEQYQLAPRIGLALVGLHCAAKSAGQIEVAQKHLAGAKLKFESLTNQEQITIGKLYGQFGLALLDFLENDTDKARARVSNLRSDLDRQTSSKVLKRIIDQLLDIEACKVPGTGRRYVMPITERRGRSKAAS